MKDTLIAIGIAFLVLFLAVIAVFYQMDRPLREARHFLLHNVDYRVVSVACFNLLTQPQYRPLLEQHLSGHDPRLPAAIRDVKAMDITISPDQVVLFKTSGFDPMGLIFHPSTTASNAYELAFREQGPGADKLLYTLTVQMNAADSGLELRGTGP